jgi:RNA polymerase sigma-70 factor, ECF subfamily
VSKSDFAPAHVPQLLTPTGCEPGVADLSPPKPLNSSRNERHFESRPQEPRAELAALYRAHHALVYRIALRYGKGNATWAEDIMQDVFLDLMKALPTLDNHEHLEGWLYRATTHRCFCRLRREKFRMLAPIRWLFGDEHVEPTTPDVLAMARQDLQRAAHALAALPPKEQIAFSMYYLDGKEQEEIGEVLGHSKGYVCKLIQRAVDKLREQGWEVPR